MSETAKIEYCTQWCKYRFNEEEMRKIAETLAHKTQELEEIEEEKKAVVSAFKERSDRVSAEQRAAARKYKDGYEMRNIECEVQRDYDAGVIRYIRIDTGEVASEVQMTMAERQLTLDQAINEASEDQSTEDEEAEIEITDSNVPPALAKYLDRPRRKGRPKKQDAATEDTEAA